MDVYVMRQLHKVVLSERDLAQLLANQTVKGIPDHGDAEYQISRVRMTPDESRVVKAD